MRSSRTSDAKSEEALQVLSWFLEILALKMVADRVLSVRIQPPCCDARSHGRATYRLLGK